MADGFFPTLVSKDANANLATNPIWIELSDGSAAITTLDVNVTNAAGASAVNIQDGGNSITVDGSVSITGSVTVTATDLDIRDLVFATDKVDVSGSTLGANSGVDIGDVTINNAAGASAVNIQDGGNSITVDGTVTANAGTGPWPVTDNGGSLTVDAVALDIRTITKATDSIQVSANTTANSAINPIFVSSASAAVTGAVHDYNTATVGGGSTSNHSYTVVTNMLLKSVEFSCSGGGKVELLTGPVASLVSRWVGFVPKQGGDVTLKLDPPIEVPTTSTGTVRLVRTNREGSSQDLYSTIIGIDA